MISSNPALHRQHSFRVEAVVLRHLDWGEADRLIWLFTQEMGKLRAVAKGVRKPRSRKAGHLEPFTRVSLLMARSREIPLITQAETVQAFLPGRDDLLRTTYAAYTIELLDRFTYEEGEHRGLYRLLVDTLDRLGQTPVGDEENYLNLVIRYYEVRLLEFVGFRPQLFQCMHCGEAIKPQDQYFSALLGGVLCPNCGKYIEGSRPISMQALKYLRHFQRSDFNEALRVNMKPLLNSEIEILMQHYLTYLLERGLNTPPFLRQVRRDNHPVVEPASEDGF